MDGWRDKWKIDGWANRQRYGLIKGEKHINE